VAVRRHPDGLGLRLYPSQAALSGRAQRSAGDFRRNGPEITERNEHISTTYAGGARTTVRPIERRVTFQVTQAWDGVMEEKIDVGADLGDCVFPFAIGRSYVVFAHRDDRGRPWTSICTRTAQREKGDDIIRTLGPPAFQPTAAVKNLP
jgi:hypothetical protein